MAQMPYMIQPLKKKKSSKPHYTRRQGARPVKARAPCPLALIDAKVNSPEELPSNSQQQEDMRLLGRFTGSKAVNKTVCIKRFNVDQNQFIQHKTSTNGGCHPR